MYVYKTHGTCSKAIEIEVNGDTIDQVRFINGCKGNTQGVSNLVKGMKVDEAAAGSTSGAQTADVVKE